MSGFDLRVLTPLSVLWAGEARALNAQDASGSFGIRAGHEPFLTVLTPGLVHVIEADGASRCFAVAGGVLTVAAGGAVTLATPEALTDTDAARLSAALAASRAARVHREGEQRQAMASAEVAAMRRLESLIQRRGSRVTAGPPRLNPGGAEA